MFEKINERIAGLNWEKEQLEDRISKLNTFISELIAEKQSECPHTGDTYEKVIYSPGSYLDKESWDTKIFCSDCDMLLKEHITVGGFG